MSAPAGLVKRKSCNEPPRLIAAPGCSRPSVVTRNLSHVRPANLDLASVAVDRKERLITLYFDSSVTTRARVLAAVDDVVAAIP